jgi:hypothetical protein
MNLSQITSKPKLIEIVMNDKETLKEFGEPIVFHTWDRQPMDVFMQLANTDQQDISAIVNIVKKLILDESGNEMLVDEKTIPTKLLMKVIGKVTEHLGK